MKIETVEVNGVIVNKGDEESAAKWAKKVEPKTPAKEPAKEPQKKGEK